MDAKSVYCDSLYAEGEELPPDPEYWRAGHTLDHCPTSDRLLLFGGYEGPSELWTLSNASSVVSQPSETAAPAWAKHQINCHGRAGHVSAVSGDNLLIYGGYDNTHFVLGDVVEINTKTYACRSVPCTGIVLNRDRRWHTACLLGRRWIIHGGWNGSGVLSNVMSYDLDTGTFEEVPMQGDALPGPRRWHSMTHLAASQMLIVGGYNGDYSRPYDDCWKMDVETLQWLEIKPRGTPPGMRHRHSMTDLGNKMILMVGGHDQYRHVVHDLYVFHTDTERWSKVENAGGLHDIQRCGHRSALAGSAYITSGGYKKTYIPTFSFFDIRMLK